MACPCCLSQEVVLELHRDHTVPLNGTLCQNANADGSNGVCGKPLGAHPKTQQGGDGGQAPTPVIVNNDLSIVWDAIINYPVHKIGRHWTLHNNVEWDQRVTSLYNREYYDTLITEIHNHHAVLIIGTPGTGKSLFLKALLLNIFERNNTHPPFIPPLSIPTIDYLRYEVAGAGTFLRRYRLLSNGSVQIYNEQLHGRPDYLLSDSVDLTLLSANILHIEVASDDSKNYNEFEKRVQDLTKHMDLFSFDELLEIKPVTMTNEEAEFRYAVYGGSARNFMDCQRLTQKVEEDVDNTMLWMFGEAKRELFFNSWMNICEKITRKLIEKEKEKFEKVFNSHMQHRTIENEVIWASTFMKILVSVILDKRKLAIVTTLQDLMSYSGMGFCFENLGHMNLTQSTDPFILHALNRPHQRKNRAFDCEMNFNLSIRLFRTIEDISALPDNTYGLPMIPNFPLVDFVIQPNIIGNYASSHSHEGAVGRLPEIRRHLHDVDHKNHQFIIVTKYKNLDIFQYNSNLSTVQQYVTTYEAPEVMATDPVQPKKTKRHKRK